MMPAFLHIVDPNECPTCGTVHAQDVECPGAPKIILSPDAYQFVWVYIHPPTPPETSVYTYTVTDLDDV